MRPVRLAPLLAALPLLLDALPARAAEPAAGDQPYRLEVVVGEVAEICGTGWVACPAGAPVCDDPKVASPVSGKLGLAFKGVAPGETLCSAAAGGSGARRVFRVVVVKPGAAPSGR